VIATGSSPTRLPTLENVGPGVITSDDVFYWNDLPRSVAVIGTGVIGLELGQALARLGVRTSVFARGGSVAQLSDPVVLQAASRVLCEELDLHFQSASCARNRTGDDVVLTTGRHDEAITERFQYVLQAAGRTPNVHDLGLEHAGLRWTTTACRPSTAAPCSAGPATSSSPATPTTSAPCCRRRPTTARSPATMPAASRTSAPACAARR
jgi:pyruvate/2-oxoglutarate dehydrogenase complex dihydrolipoamide dehydrogenase (E3) component